MKKFLTKLKPTKGFSHTAHFGLLALLPLIAFALVKYDFVQLAVLIVLLSKWRMLAVKPRFWAAIIRANSVDLIVGVSLVLFMANSESLLLQLIWVLIYGVWLILIKPGTSSLMISMQATIGQLFGLFALFIAWPDGPLYGLVFLAGLICFLSARHFLDSFDELYAKLLSYLWAFFGAALIWVLGHWLLYFYGTIPQAVLILSTLGYGLAALYYLDHDNKLTPILRKQFIFVIIATMLVILTFSDWGDKVV